MPAVIPVTGFASNYRTPSIGLELVFAQGESIGGAGARQCVQVGPKLASGTWTANTLYGPIKSEQEVIDGAGAGSCLHRWFRKFAKANKRASVYILPCAETSGGTPLQAIGTMAITGTATSDKTWTFMVCDEEISVFIKTGDLAATVATNIRAIVNGKTHLPVTAAGTAGDVAFTSKHFGIRGGNGTYNPLRITGVTPGNGISATFADVGATTAGAEGTTTEAANITTALQTIDGRLFYYIGYDNFGNSTAMAAIKSHIANKSLPRYGRRSYAISGYNGTVAAYTTIANGLNYERIGCAVHPRSQHDPATLCAQLMASVQLKHETNPAFGFINYAGADWDLLPTDSQYWLDEDDINDAIAAGASIIANKVGGTYLVMNLTTRSKDGSGTYADFRAAEAHRVSVADAFAAEWTSTMATYLGKGFKEHPKLPNGLPNPNARVAPGVATEFTMRPPTIKLLSDYENAGYTQRLDDSVASFQMVKSPINAGRAEAGLNLYAIDVLSQITCRIAESSAA